MNFQETSSQGLIELLHSCEVVRHGHIVFGDTHTDTFIDARSIQQDSSLRTSIGTQILLRLILSRENVRKNPRDYTLIAHKSGGRILRDIASLVTDNFGMHYARIRGSEDEFSFNRSQRALVKGRKIILIDDFLTNGRFIRAAAQAVIDINGIPEFAVTMWNRGNCTIESIPVKALINKHLNHWPADQCPMCKEGIPITSTYK